MAHPRDIRRITMFIWFVLAGIFMWIITSVLIDDPIESGIAFAYVILAGVLFIVIDFAKERDAENEKFMAECTKDYKEYECEAMLRTTCSSSPVIIQMKEQQNEK